MAEQTRARQHFWPRQAPPVPTPSTTYAAPATPAASAASAAAVSAAQGVPQGSADPYAPKPSLFSSAPPTGPAVRLFEDKREEEQLGDAYEDMSALFSVITAVERLENIWARRGAMSQEDYGMQCSKLIQQYHVLRASTATTIPNINMFIAEYDLKASKALPRLTAGVPATVQEPAGARGAERDQRRFVFRCTGLFHHLGTCIDMEQTAVCTLLPDLTSLMKTLNRVTALGTGFEFNRKIRFWVEKLNAMPPADRLTEEDSQQLKLDLDNGYVEFESAISY